MWLKASHGGGGGVDPEVLNKLIISHQALKYTHTHKLTCARNPEHTYAGAGKHCVESEREKEKKEWKEESESIISRSVDARRKQK